VSRNESAAWARWSVGQRRLAGAVCLALAALSLVHYVGDLRLRDPAERFVRNFSVDRRHPFEVAAMRLEPSGDLACAMAVDAALRETPRVPPEELMEARDLMLRALAVRPGWPFHAYLLGQTAAGLSAHSDGGDPPSRPDQWAVPLRVAARAAPGADSIAEVRGSAYLEMWPHLDSALRAEAAAALPRAFLDPAFVSREFPAAVAALGAPEASALIPDAARPLREAVRVLSAAGDIQAMSTLYPRLLLAERGARADDLRKIEKRDRLGDLEGKRTACLNWVAEHAIGEYDDAPGRAEVARLLELWPSDRWGAWTADPRADLVAFFLNGREEAVRAGPLARTVEALAGVPSSIRARAKVLAGDESGALELAGQAEPDSFEWVPFFASLARLKLRQGEPAQARAALERLPPAAMDDCEVLLARREVAQVLADGREVESVRQKLESAAPGGRRDSWSPGGTLLLCLDPLRVRGHVLEVSTQTASPAVVAYGWDGGRAGISSIPKGEGVLRIPVAGLSGRRSLSIRALAGGPVQPVKATLEPIS
jgi:hypothetical protein